MAKERGTHLWLEALGRGPVATADSGADSNDLGVDPTRDAPVLLDVEFWEGVLLVHRGLGNVSHGGLLDHVSNQEPLDGLVLGDKAGAVDAADCLDVTTALFVASVISSLGCLFCPHCFSVFVHVAIVAM